MLRKIVGRRDKNEAKRTFSILFLIPHMGVTIGEYC
jgi:hypothetical protein